MSRHVCVSERTRSSGRSLRRRCKPTSLPAPRYPITACETRCYSTNVGTWVLSSFACAFVSVRNMVTAPPSTQSTGQSVRASLPAALRSGCGTAVFTDVGCEVRPKCEVECSVRRPFGGWAKSPSGVSVFPSFSGARPHAAPRKSKFMSSGYIFSIYFQHTPRARAPTQLAPPKKTKRVRAKVCELPQ